MPKILQRIALIFSSTVLILFLLSALFSLVFDPEPTITSGRQHPALAFLDPGSTTKFLKVMENDTEEGKAHFEYHPFDSIELDGNEFILYLGSQARRMHLLDVYYALDALTLRSLTSSTQDEVLFIDQFGEEHNVAVSSLANRALDEIVIERRFYLGTDPYGRDVLVQLIDGSLNALIIGALSTIISLILGVIIGMIGGYAGGWIGHVIQWKMHVIWSIPSILMVIAMSSILGAGVASVVIGICVVQWIEVAQVVYSAVKRIRSADYIKAVELLGLSNSKVIVNHIFPNVKWSLPVMCAIVFSNAMVLEAGLSFLGIGLPESQASWGNMIRSTYGYLISEEYAYLAIVPSIALFLVVLSLVILTSVLKRLKTSSQSGERRGGFV